MKIYRPPFYTYQLFDHDGEPLYTGATQHLPGRLSHHRNGDNPYGHLIDSRRTITAEHDSLLAVNIAERDNLRARPWKHNRAGVMGDARLYNGYGAEDADVRTKTLATINGLQGTVSGTWEKEHSAAVVIAKDAIARHLAANPKDAAKLDADGFMLCPEPPREPTASENFAALVRRTVCFDKTDCQASVRELLRHFTMAEILHALAGTEL